MTQPAVRTKNPVASHPWTSALIAVLVLADIWFTLYVPLYARATPKVGAFPFFYFYLMIYMPMTGILLWIVFLLQKRLRPSGGSGNSSITSASHGEVIQ